ncbi:hypothetical protein QVD17_10223 [Tagetes erecta]|uniref:FHA domain-containing protein n=1 Tax=Tagetes erecta TaxID=13708 RepID=A0AAD8L5B9_TARER|nr:hypothetical protein QVD17_10223 [Tagetes erecta]
MMSSSLIPADDLLRKNSIEAGGSQEELAKGNKRIPSTRKGGSICKPYYRTRRRIKSELSNSPDSSFVDSCHSFQDHVALNHQAQEALAIGNEKIHVKRKRGSICITYYRTRRRIKSESFNFPDLSSSDRCTYFQDHVTLTPEAQAGGVMFSDCLANSLESTTTTYLDNQLADGCHEAVQNDYMDGSMREDGLYKLTENVCLLLTDNLMSFFDPDIEPEDDKHLHKVDSDNSSAVTEVEYASLPDSLWSFSDKECVVCSLNTEDTIDDIPNSQLLNSPVNVLEYPSFQGDDEQDVCHWEDDVESTSISHLDLVQLSDGEIICTLNTIDPEIPCNDNISLLNHQYASVKPQVATDSIDLASSFTQSQMDCLDLSSEIDSAHSHAAEIDTSTSEHKSDSDLPSFPDIEDPEFPCSDDRFLLVHQSPSVRPQIATDSIDPTSSFTSLQMDCPDLSSEIHSAHLDVGNTLKSVPMDDNPSMLDHNYNRYLHCFRDIGNPEMPSPFVTPQTATDSTGLTSYFTQSQMEVSHLSSEFDSANPHVGSTLISPSVDLSPSVSDCNNSDSDSNSDLPCLPEIEALILKLEFNHAQDSGIANEVKRRKYTHCNMTINTMKQSSSQRTMSSLGAFAVFSSRHYNYFIKKTEVTVGRSTDDTNVDIDLRKESHANLISRQQAIIKMETDGTFTLTNIGKGRSILVTGKPIDHGQVAALGSGCLIQIRGMNFMFEINERYVRCYLDIGIQKSQGKFRTYEWSVN